MKISSPGAKYLYWSYVACCKASRDGNPVIYVRGGAPAQLAGVHGREAVMEGLWIWELGSQSTD